MGWENHSHTGALKTLTFIILGWKKLPNCIKGGRKSDYVSVPGSFIKNVQRNTNLEMNGINFLGYGIKSYELY